jgi:hypothetical protein
MILEADSRPGRQECPVMYRVQRFSNAVLGASYRFYPVPDEFSQHLLPDLLRLHFNIILPFTPRSRQWSDPVRHSS